MRSAKILIPVALLAMMTACGPVEWLNPFYNDSDITFDPELVGRWDGANGSSMLRFQKVDDKTYKVVDIEVQSGGTRQKTKFEGHLVKLGDRLFLDLLPQSASPHPGPNAFSLSEDENAPQPHLVEVGDGLYASLVRAPQPSGESAGGSYELQLFQGHWVFRVWREGDTLRLADLNEDWFKGAVNQGEVEIDHEEVNDTLVLTAPTPDLRAFLLEHAGDEGAFSMPEEAFSRLK